VEGTEEADPTPQEQVLDPFDQPLARGASALSAYPAYVAPVTPLPNQLSPEIVVLEPYQQPLQQIAPYSFEMAINGDETIGGARKEKQQARKEYKQALAAGKMVYLLEQSDPDGKCLKDMEMI